MLYEKYTETTKDKNSFININLDWALPKQRKNRVIPERFLQSCVIATLLAVMGQQGYM